MVGGVAFPASPLHSPWEDLSGPHLAGALRRLNRCVDGCGEGVLF